jgi:hypothetical protein
MTTNRRFFSFVLLAFIILALLSGCHKETPAPVVPSAPTMTGRWHYSLTGKQTYTWTWDITDSSGTLSCMMVLNNSNVPMSGTCSPAGAISVGGSDADGRYMITGTASADRKTFTGRIDLYNTRNVYQGYMTITATKR